MTVGGSAPRPSHFNNLVFAGSYDDVFSECVSTQFKREWRGKLPPSSGDDYRLHSGPAPCCLHNKPLIGSHASNAFIMLSRPYQTGGEYSAPRTGGRTSMFSSCVSIRVGAERGGLRGSSGSARRSCIDMFYRASPPNSSRGCLASRSTRPKCFSVAVLQRISTGHHAQRQ